MSRNALYAVFNEHGDVQAYSGERRLQRCYETINADDRAAESIGAIAFSLGFRSEAHFSRAFKKRFGVGPRDCAQWRASAASICSPPRRRASRGNRCRRSVGEGWSTDQRSRAFSAPEIS